MESKKISRPMSRTQERREGVTEKVGEESDGHKAHRK